MTREFIITNEQGIHARPATVIVQKANQFESDMTITYGDITTDLKSIMGVLSLGVLSLFDSLFTSANHFQRDRLYTAG